MVESHVRVMTWNVWWRFGPQWRERQPAIRATIAHHAPDVVALQEVWSAGGTTQAHELAAELGFDAMFASPSYPPPPAPPAANDHDGVDLGLALLSRWPILTSEAVPMPARHRSWDPVILRVLVDTRRDRCHCWSRASTTPPPTATTVWRRLPCSLTSPPTRPWTARAR